MRDPRERAETLIRIQQSRSPYIVVGGLEIQSESNSTLEVFSPADGSVLGRCPSANATDVEKAVVAAQKAFEDSWSVTSPEARAAFLYSLAETIEEQADDFAILEALQTGRTFREVLEEDVLQGAKTLKYYAGLVDKNPGEFHHLSWGSKAYSQNRPFPVVGALLPGPEPLATGLRCLAAVLAAGGCIVLKPPPGAPLSLLKLAETAQELSFPPGVINVVPGTGSQSGQALAESSGVSALCFAGTIENARRVMVASAKSNLKPVHLSLPGKAATIVFDDANIKLATDAIWRSIFTGRAQLNRAGSRLLLHRDIYDEMVATITARAREIVVGHPLDEHTELGPLMNQRQLKRVLAYVELGRREGARLVAGGVRDVDELRAQGYYMAPTVFMDVKSKMRIAREAIGGPVLTITRFSSEEEALELTKSTPYGLSASIWTDSFARAHRLSQALPTGAVYINQAEKFSAALPYGGNKLSGQGRSFGKLSLQQFCSSQAVFYNLR